MRRTVCAVYFIVVFALIYGLPAILAHGKAGNSGVTITVSATPVFAPPPAPPGINWGLVVGFIGGAIVVLGLLYFFLIRRRRAWQ